MDFVQTLDPSKLVLAGTGLSFLLSIAAVPPYNFPLFLFGFYAGEAQESSQALQIFTPLLGTSIIFDVVWMIRNDQNGLFKFLTVCLTLLKLPTFLAFANALRQRGGGQFGGLGGGHLGGPTVWSMPGGFTSGGEGYQTVGDDDSFVRNVRPGPTVPHKPTAQTETTPPGAYQSV